MLKQEPLSVDETQALQRANQMRVAEIPNALPMRLQTLDIARHTVIAPDGKRYVLASYNDIHLGRSWVTVVYPQQNAYLTLVRLPVCEFVNQTQEEALQRHISLAQVIQQGKLSDYQKLVR